MKELNQQSSTEERDTEFVTTALNIKEIAVGRALQAELDPPEIRSTFDWVQLLPLDTDTAFVAGEFEAALHRDEDVNQDKINALAGNLLIAAVAKQRDATVVTQNTNDFERFDGAGPVALLVFKEDDYSHVVVDSGTDTWEFAINDETADSRWEISRLPDWIEPVLTSIGIRAVRTGQEDV